MKPGEQEARRAIAVELAALTKQLTADLCSISGLVVRLVGDATTGDVIGSLRRLKTPGPSFRPVARSAIKRLEAFAMMPKEKAAAGRKKRRLDSVARWEAKRLRQRDQEEARRNEPPPVREPRSPVREGNVIYLGRASNESDDQPPAA